MVRDIWRTEQWQVQSPRGKPWCASHLVQLHPMQPASNAFINTQRELCKVCIFSLTDDTIPEYCATGSFSTLEGPYHLYLLSFPCTCRQLTKISYFFRNNLKLGRENCMQNMIHQEVQMAHTGEFQNPNELSTRRPKYISFFLSKVTWMLTRISHAIHMLAEAGNLYLLVPDSSVSNIILNRMPRDSWLL